jgi:hypothetical protein
MNVRRPSLLWLIVALLVMPSLCAAQAPLTDQEISTDLAPFIGRWSGQHEECASGSSCESRSVEMIISVQEGRISVVANLGPASAGMQRYSKGSKGPITRTYTGVLEEKNGVHTLSFTTPSGAKVVLKRRDGTLFGQGSGGRFQVSYSLRKAGG